MRLYRKRAGGPWYADATHPETGARWQFATMEADEMKARASAEDRIAKMRAALGGGAGGTTTGLTAQAPSAAPPATVPPAAPPSTGAQVAPGNKLAAALVQMRAGAASNPGVPGSAALAPSPAAAKLAAIIGKKGTPIVVGVGEEFVRQGFWFLEKREPRALDEDEEDDLGEALGEYLATILPDASVGPGGKLAAIFVLTFAFAWLRGKPIPKPEPPKDQPPRPALA